MRYGSSDLGLILSQSSISYLAVRTPKRSVHLCKCLIRRVQLMSNKITAYHQLVNMTVIEIVWIWSGLQSRVRTVGYRCSIGFSVSWFFLCSIYHLTVLRFRDGVKCGYKNLLPLVSPSNILTFLHLPPTQESQGLCNSPWKSFFLFKVALQ